MNKKKWQSLFHYMGGKGFMLEELNKIIRSIPHNYFVDLFAGAGYVVMNHPKFYSQKFENVKLYFNDKSESIYLIM